MSPDAEHTGHAAVGYVTGVRRDDGSAPERVHITYRAPNGVVRTATVLREVNVQQVEDTDDDTARFFEPLDNGETREIRAAAVQHATPKEDTGA